MVSSMRPSESLEHCLERSQGLLRCDINSASSRGESAGLGLNEASIELRHTILFRRLRYIVLTPTGSYRVLANVGIRAVLF